MGDHPILFSASMIRALIAGTKTQTRRIVKGAPVGMVRLIGRDDRPTGEYGFCATHDRVINRHIACPYGVPGDVLWVRETWQSDVAHAYTKPSLIPHGERFFYRAGGSQNTTDLSVCATGWRPGIHMPRWASRITLRVTDVRVERLNEISEADCIAEGIWSERLANGTLWHTGAEDRDGEITALTAQTAYCRLFEHINGHDREPDDPWLWCVSFERIALPLDMDAHSQMGEGS